MTAEVVIANSSAVAVAADSAVTIGNQKIYNSALKVFALSKVSPVAIMIYGNSSLMGVPWEPIIKTYRSSLGDVRYKRLEDYARNFLRSLTARKDCFPKDLKLSWMESNVGGYFLLIKDNFQREVQSNFDQDIEVTDETSESLFKDTVNKHHSKLSNLTRIKGIGPVKERNVRRKNTQLFKTLANKVFQQIPRNRSTIEKLYDIATFIQTREIFSQSVSGIVVTGFGLSEIYPSIASYQVEGIVEGCLKYRFLKDKSFKIENPTQCVITPFAQEDMVSTFMRGMNPAVHMFIMKYLQQLSERFPELIGNESLAGTPEQKQELRERLNGEVRTLFSSFVSELESHTDKKHIKPILDMVGGLPKEDLASMAESLVNLTAFKRKMTQNVETVGGPIDVAVISKGDGLVWVKRKHYFPRDLNQHFFQNYFRELDA